MVKRPGLRIYVIRIHGPALQIQCTEDKSASGDFSYPSACLISKALGGRHVAPCDERAIAQFLVDFAVRQRQSGRIKNSAAGRAQDRVARRRVPFHRWREPRIDIPQALGDETKLEG